MPQQLDVDAIIRKYSAPQPPPSMPGAGPYDAIIDLYAADYGVDPDLVRSIITAESAGDPMRVSPKRAAGLMQLMPETAKQYGVTDPKDPDQNIRAGIQHLRWLLDRFGGDETKAIAAYNAGHVPVEAHKGVPPYPETRAYVAKVQQGRGAQRPRDEFYDYDKARAAGATPDASGHWPSEFKKPGHPNLVVGGFDTRTGERVPGTPRMSEPELVAHGWDPDTAKRLASMPEPAGQPEIDVDAIIAKYSGSKPPAKTTPSATKTVAPVATTEPRFDYAAADPLYAPVDIPGWAKKNVQQIQRGLEAVAPSLNPLEGAQQMFAPDTPPEYVVGPVTEAVRLAPTKPRSEVFMGGINDVVEGLMSLGAPLLVPAALTSLGLTAATVGIAMSATEAARVFAAKAGLSPEAQRLVGNAAGFAALGVGSGRILRAAGLDRPTADVTLRQIVGDIARWYERKTVQKRPGLSDSTIEGRVLSSEPAGEAVVSGYPPRRPTTEAPATQAEPAAPDARETPLPSIASPAASQPPPEPPVAAPEPAAPTAPAPRPTWPPVTTDHALPPEPLPAPIVPPPTPAEPTPPAAQTPMTEEQWRQAAPEQRLDEMRQMAPPDAPAPATEAGYTLVDADRIQLDPRTYQFKASDAKGETGALRNVTAWDTLQANVSPILLHETLDGQLFVADGHQRVNLAQRMKAQGQDVPPLPAIVLKEAEGWTAAEVRRTASLINIRNESATAIDVARLLREGPLTNEELASVPKGSVRGEKFGQAQELAKLSDDAFRMVINGEVAPGQAQYVGLWVKDAELQAPALKALADADVPNAYQAERFVKEWLKEQKAVEYQPGLFGEQLKVISLAREKAQILDAVKRALSSKKSAFGNVLRYQTQLEQAGNVLNADVNAQLATEAGRFQALLAAFADKEGYTQAALREAARRVHAREISPADAVDDVIAALERDFRGDEPPDSGSSGPGGPPPQPPGPRGPAPDQSGLRPESGEAPGAEEPPPVSLAELEAAGQGSMFGPEPTPEPAPPPVVPVAAPKTPEIPGAQAIRIRNRLAEKKAASQAAFDAKKQAQAAEPVAPVPEAKGPRPELTINLARGQHDPVRVIFVDPIDKAVFRALAPDRGLNATGLYKNKGAFDDLLAQLPGHDWQTVMRAARQFREDVIAQAKALPKRIDETDPASLDLRPARSFREYLEANHGAEPDNVPPVESDDLSALTDEQLEAQKQAAYLRAYNDRGDVINQESYAEYLNIAEEIGSRLRAQWERDESTPDVVPRRLKPAGSTVRYGQDEYTVLKNGKVGRATWSRSGKQAVVSPHSLDPATSYIPPELWEPIDPPKAEAAESTPTEPESAPEQAEPLVDRDRITSLGSKFAESKAAFEARQATRNEGPITQRARRNQANLERELAKHRATLAPRTPEQTGQRSLRNEERRLERDAPLYKEVLAPTETAKERGERLDARNKIWEAEQAASRLKAAQVADAKRLLVQTLVSPDAFRELDQHIPRVMHHQGDDYDTMHDTGHWTNVLRYIRRPGETNGLSTEMRSVVDKGLGRPTLPPGEAMPLHVTLGRDPDIPGKEPADTEAPSEPSPEAVEQDLAQMADVLQEQPSIATPDELTRMIDAQKAKIAQAQGWLQSFDYRLRDKGKEELPKLREGLAELERRAGIKPAEEPESGDLFGGEPGGGKTQEYRRGDRVGYLNSDSVGEVLTTGPLGVRVHWLSGRMAKEQGTLGWTDTPATDLHPARESTSPTTGSPQPSLPGAESVRGQEIATPRLGTIEQQLRAGTPLWQFKRHEVVDAGFDEAHQGFNTWMHDFNSAWMLYQKALSGYPRVWNGTNGKRAREAATRLASYINRVEDAEARAAKPPSIDRFKGEIQGAFTAWLESGAVASSPPGVMQDIRNWMTTLLRVADKLDVGIREQGWYESGHQRAVRDAVREGKPVPSEVLSPQYPGFQRPEPSKAETDRAAFNARKQKRSL